MNLDLSLVLNPAELGAFSDQCEAALVTINDHEIISIKTVTEYYERERETVYRRVLLSVLGLEALQPPPVGVSGLPAESAIMVTPTEALEVPVQESLVVNEAKKTFVENVEKSPKVKPSVSGLTRKQLAQRLGCNETSIYNYDKRGFITRIEGTGTGVGNPCLYRASDIPALKAAIAELREKKDETISKVLAESRKGASAVTVTEVPENKIEAPEPRPAPQLTEATKHAYHWQNALPVLEAGIAQAEKEGDVALDVSYQSTPGKYEEAGAFVVRPFGMGIGTGLTAFVRATRENGKWSVTIPLRVESWIKPMAEALKSHWPDLAKVSEVRAHNVATLPLPSSGSPTRSLQP